MAVVGADPQAAERIRDLDKRHVLHSWSVQSAINPLPVAGAEGRYFWDYDGNRYLDFASQLVNVSIGHQHPKVVAAIKEQAERSARSARHGRGEPLRAGAAARGGHARRPDDVVLHERRRRGERERDQARALGDRPPTRSSRAIAPTTAPPPARSRSPATRAAGPPSRASRVVRMLDPYTYRCPAGHPDPARSAPARRTSRRSSSTRAPTRSPP